MALPKNYNQTEKRVESLNDLTFYTVTYEYEFTEEFIGRDGTNDGLDSLVELINGTKEFTALDDESAEQKVLEWLESLVTQQILKDYDVTEITTKTFYETIKDKNLDKILDL